MKIRSYIFAAVFFLCASLTMAQKETYNWYFGEGAGISFTESLQNPKFLSGNKFNSEWACASISDRYGNLLFYTDGNAIRNSEHEIMPNGELGVSDYVGETLIISPQPGNTKLFYLFYAPKDQPGYVGLHYSIVDMTLDGGKGDVYRKHILLNENAGLRIALAKHSNGKDLWILSYDDRKKVFVAYMLTNQGITGSVESSIVLNATSKPGLMKVSLNGKKIAVCDIYNSAIEVLDFNNMTGGITRSLKLRNLNWSNVHGLEFSPDASKLYASVTNGESNSRIYQLDLTRPSEDDISAHPYIVAEIYQKSAFGAMQIGPDRKIYIASYDNDYIDAIFNPNDLGVGCLYIKRAVIFDRGLCKLGLPVFLYDYNNIPTNYKFKVDSNSPLCEGDTLRLSVTVEPPLIDPIFEWGNEQGFFSNKQFPTAPGVVPEISGYYWATVKTAGVKFRDSLYVEIMPKPQADIIIVEPESICEQQRLQVEPYIPEYVYRWSTGETGKSIAPPDTGDYYVEIESENGCVDTARIFAEITPKLKVSVATNKPPAICEGDSVLLSANVNQNECVFRWSNGSDKTSIVAKEAGVYEIVVENANGCLDTASVKVETLENPAANIIAMGETEFCEGDSVKLTATPAGSAYDYLWSNGSTKQSITVYESGTYSVSVYNFAGCSDMAEKTVTVFDASDFEIISSKGEILCPRDTITLSVDEKYSEAIWSNGEVGSSVTISEAGEYSASYTNKRDCLFVRTIEIEKSPDKNISVDGEQFFCKGESVILTANGDFDDYLWSNGDSGVAVEVSEPGAYIASAEDENGCVFESAPFYLNHFPVELLPVPDDVEFDTSYVGVEKRLRLSLINEKNSPIIIKNVFLTNENDDVEISYRDTPYELLPNENFPVQVVINPQRLGYYQNRIGAAVKTNCDDTLYVPVSAKSVVDMRVSLPDTAAVVGDPNFCLPLSARLMTELDIFSQSSLLAEARFDCQSIMPDDIGVIRDNKRVVSLKKNSVAIGNQDVEITRICGYIMLGNEQEYLIEISAFDWEDEFVNIKLDDGVLSLYGVCAHDLTKIRYFQPSEMILAPNPASDKIDVAVSSGEIGQFMISVISAQGKIVEKISWSNSSELFEKYKTFDLRNCAPGIYFIRLQTPMKILDRKILIVK